MDYACPHDKFMGTCLLDINMKRNYEAGPPKIVSHEL